MIPTSFQTCHAYGLIPQKWPPCSVIVPFSSTQMQSVFFTVDNRCAIMSTVLFFASATRRLNLTFIIRSANAVASSKISTGAFLRLPVRSRSAGVPRRRDSLLSLRQPYGFSGNFSNIIQPAVSSAASTFFPTPPVFPSSRSRVLFHGSVLHSEIPRKWYPSALPFEYFLYLRLQL